MLEFDFREEDEDCVQLDADETSLIQTKFKEIIKDVLFGEDFEFWSESEEHGTEVGSSESEEEEIGETETEETEFESSEEWLGSDSSSSESEETVELETSESESFEEEESEEEETREWERERETVEWDWGTNETESKPHEEGEELLDEEIVEEWIEDGEGKRIFHIIRSTRHYGRLIPPP